ncbi:MAG: hypothetical protein Q4D80_05095 [Pseudomonadota bacterium]|nr:hypothetical protein [Pseudomonadota bacterium]
MIIRPDFILMPVSPNDNIETAAAVFPSGRRKVVLFGNVLAEE